MVVGTTRCVRPLASIAALLLSAGVGRAQPTVDVYRCVDPAGAVSLQDRPCPPSHTASRREVVRELDAPPLAAKLQARDGSPAAPESRESPPEPIRPEPPPLWRCVDFDGSERESEDGRPRGRYVPLWVVGRDPGAPAQLFGRVGAAPARPAMTPGGGPPTTYSPRGNAQPTVYVEERCYLLSPAARCARLQEERAAIERRRFNAQPTERAELGKDSDALRATLAESCGG